MSFSWEAMSDEHMLETIAEGPGPNSDPIVAWLTGMASVTVGDGLKWRFVVIPITIEDSTNFGSFGLDPYDNTPEVERDIVRPDGLVESISGAEEWESYVRRKCGKPKP